MKCHNSLKPKNKDSSGLHLQYKVRVKKTISLLGKEFRLFS